MRSYRESYFKELAHTIVEAGRYNICRKGWQTHERPDAAVQVQRPSVLESLLSQGDQVFSFHSDFQPTAWGPLALGRAIAWPKFTSLDSFRNTLTETSRITFGQLSVHCGPPEPTHKINCPTSSYSLFLLLFLFYGVNVPQFVYHSTIDGRQDVFRFGRIMRMWLYHFSACFIVTIDAHFISRGPVFFFVLLQLCFTIIFVLEFYVCLCSLVNNFLFYNILVRF